MVCPRCELTEHHVHSEDLTDGEHYALWYALAVTNPGTKYERTFKDAEARVRLTAADKKAILTSGLAGLHGKGLVSLARDGMGEYQPAEVHLSLLVGGKLVMGDLS